MATATLIVRHQVEDYGAWRAVYDSAEALRRQHGGFGAEVLTQPGDKNDLLVIHRFPSLEQAQAFAGSTALHDVMHRAGVRGAPRVDITVEV